ncbi:MAG: hypothetical protein KC917_18755, partial [Candidatus Omnitrophica bacterium]|nr:hypothetical protein [Candidatus Omnitrophota bacterium]
MSLVGSLVIFLALTGAFGVDTLSVHPDKANVITFPQLEAKFIRFLITSTNGGEPCIDEIELYGEDKETNLALATAGSEATASSCLPGHAIHRIPHLNDGQVGNGHSWIAAGTVDEWAQIELPEATLIEEVVFSRDRTGVYRDRTPIGFEILLSIDGREWKSVRKVRSPAPSSAGPSKIPVPPPPSKEDTETPTLESTIRDEDSLLRYAFLGEEHAWLKTHGRADLSSELVPYNGRVKEYPRHRGDDTIPLPNLESAPILDGSPDDECWERSSRGVVRVAHMAGFNQSPCVEHMLYAGRHDGNLFLFLRIDRLLSSHLAVISNSDGDGIGVVAYQKEELAFLTYDGNGNVVETTPLEGGYDDYLTAFEIKIPLNLIPECTAKGIRMGLGMGGKHTSPTGRPINLFFSNFAMGQIEDDQNGRFQIRLVASSTEEIQFKGNTADLKDGLTLAPGELRILSIAPQEGAIGPEYDLHV